MISILKEKPELFPALPGTLEVATSTAYRLLNKFDHVSDNAYFLGIGGHIGAGVAISSTLYCCLSNTGLTGKLKAGLERVKTGLSIVVSTGFLSAYEGYQELFYSSGSAEDLLANLVGATVGTACAKGIQYYQQKQNNL